MAMHEILQETMREQNYTRQTTWNDLHPDKVIAGGIKTFVSRMVRYEQNVPYISTARGLRLPDSPPASEAI